MTGWTWDFPPILGTTNVCNCGNCGNAKKQCIEIHRKPVNTDKKKKTNKKSGFMWKSSGTDLRGMRNKALPWTDLSFRALDDFPRHLHASEQCWLAIAPPPQKNRKVSIAKSDYLCFLGLDVVSRRPTAESRTKWQPHRRYPTRWSAESFLNTRIRSCLIIYIIYQRCLNSNISNLY